MASGNAFSMAELNAPLTDREVSSGELCCPSFLSCFLGVITGAAICSCRQVQQRESLVLLSFGKYLGTLTEPGCYCVNPFGTESSVISTATQTQHINQVKIADANGNPLLISAVVTYRIVSPVKAVLDVFDYSRYVQDQALTVMKRVASMYPYEAKPGEHSLKSEAKHVQEMMVSYLQQKATVAGIQIVSYDLSDLSYAPEVAQGLLVRQQAEATLGARSVIAKGAITIATETISELEAQGIVLPEEDKATLVTNLLITICGDAKPISTIQMSQIS